MKSFEKILIAGMSVLFLSGCASLPPFEMTRQNYIKSPCYLAPLSFERFKRPENWESEKEWNNHVQTWRLNFDACTMGSIWHKAQYLEKEVKTGLVVKPYVMNIEKHWKPVFGGDDTMAIYVELIDAGSGEQIGRMSYTRDSSGVNWMESFSFGGRIGQCARQAGYTLGNALEALLKN